MPVHLQTGTLWDAQRSVVVAGETLAQAQRHDSSLCISPLVFYFVSCAHSSTIVPLYFAVALFV